MDSPTITFRSNDIGYREGQAKRYVLIQMTYSCCICTECDRAIWPTHYFPRGVRVEDVERDYNVTHGHEGDLCDKCKAKLDLQAKEKMKAFYIEQGIDMDKLDELLRNQGMSAWDTHDPSISHDTEYPEKDTHGDDPANY